MASTSKARWRGRHRAPSPAVAIPLAMATAVATGMATAPAGPARADSSPAVLGSTPVQLQRSAKLGAGAALVHGVRRIAGGTALYYSYGSPSSAAAGSIFSFDRTQVLLSYGILGPLLVDVAGGTAYAALTTDRGRRRVETAAASSVGSKPGTYSVLWTVMPELPASTTTVDVMLGQGEVIPGVPVESGPLTPTVPGTAPVPLGTGWPEVDAALVAGGSASQSVFPLRSVVSTIDNSSTTRTSSGQVAVDLSADVLFAVDRATLTAAAVAKIRAAAGVVNAGARGGGAVAVVGFTDDTGTSPHNLDLSRRRAAAVAAVLKPLVTVAGLTLTVSGLGESEPVASNGTAAGRQANRRVSIRFTKAGS